jgi:hypothetical protein
MASKFQVTPEIFKTLSMKDKKRLRERWAEVFSECFVHTHAIAKSANMAQMASRGQEYLSKAAAQRAGRAALDTEPMKILLAKKRKKYLDGVGISPETVLMELAKITKARLPDLLKVEENGQVYYDLTLIDEDTAAAMGECTIETFTDGRGSNAREVKRVRIKLLNKLDAIEKMMKHYGLFEKDQEGGFNMIEAILAGRRRAGEPDPK